MAGKMSKKAAYKFKFLSGEIDPKQHIDQVYVSAFQKGYSVVEIARLGGFKSASYVHAALVKKGILASAKPGPQAKGTIPTKMRIHLTTRGLTFAQWCAGWGFDQAEVKKEVDELNGMAMAAIKQDFPSYYKLLTGVMVDDYAKPVAQFVMKKSSVSITWDVSKGCYRAEILPQRSVGYGPNLQAALKAGQVGAWTIEVARRLVNLPNKKDLEKPLIW